LLPFGFAISLILALRGKFATPETSKELPKPVTPAGSVCGIRE
jgi:hypothetical protein